MAPALSEHPCLHSNRNTHTSMHMRHLQFSLPSHVTPVLLTRCNCWLQCFAVGRSEHTRCGRKDASPQARNSLVLACAEILLFSLHSMRAYVIAVVVIFHLVTVVCLRVYACFGIVATISFRHGLSECARALARHRPTFARSTRRDYASRCKLWVLWYARHSLQSEAFHKCPDLLRDVREHILENFGSDLDHL